MYLPIIKADPPSHLRQLAYREGSALIGPEGDPDGWKVLPSVTVAGTIFGARQVELQCTVRMLGHHITHQLNLDVAQVALSKPVSCSQAFAPPMPL